MNKKLLLGATLLGAMGILFSCGENNPTINPTKPDEPSQKEEDVDKADAYDVEVNLNLKKISTFKISDKIYGSSFENLGDVTYDGIWSEIIRDRKFFDPIGQDRSQWSIGSKASTAKSGTFEGKYSALINEGGSIKQRFISLDEVDYSGYLYAKGNGKLSIKYESDKNVVEQTISVSSTNSYKKYSYEIKGPKKDKNYILTITAISGNITIDSLSLMPKNNFYGMRREVVDLLKEQAPGLLRWPGGDFVSGYDFYDGIGDRDLRPCKRNLAWAGHPNTFSSENTMINSDISKIGTKGHYFYYIIDPNDFGLEEFLVLCKEIKATPNVVVNTGLGTVKMAEDEIDFVNGGVSTEYGAKRQYQKDPYKVTYWSIGNEMYGSHELGHKNVDEYSEVHKKYYKALKAKDKSIITIASSNNASPWAQELLRLCTTENIDYMSEHFYAVRKEDNPEEHIKSLIENAGSRIRNMRNLDGLGSTKMSIDEYGYSNVTSKSRLMDGMGVAGALNTMIENGDLVKIACFSETVNATQGTITTDEFNAYMQTNGYVIAMYKKNMQEYFVKATTKVDKNNYHFVAATINEKHDEITLSVVNASKETLRIACDEFKDCKYMDYIVGESLSSFNKEGAIRVTRHSRNLSGKKFLVEPLSISLIKIGV